MNILKTPIPDLFIIEPRVFEDPRGYFFESYNQANLDKAGINFHFVQDNQSKSGYGVLRGLHYQLSPKSQTKLVRVLQGAIFDVAVDVRQGSPTYGKWFGVELSDTNRKQLLVPKGFAHGFSVLSETAVVLYKCDELYAPDYDAGIRFDDKTLNIDWGIPKNKIILSDKDARLPAFEEAKNNFNYK